MRVSVERGEWSEELDKREKLVRALRGCQVPYSANACERCSCGKGWYSCVVKLMRGAADLIETMAREAQAHAEAPEAAD